MPSVSKNESEHKSEEIIETKVKAPKTKTAEKELKSLPAWRSLRWNADEKEDWPHKTTKTLKPAQKPKKPSPKKEKEVEIEAPKQKKRDIKLLEKEKEKEKEKESKAAVVESSAIGEASKTGLMMAALQAFCTVLQTISK